MQYLLLDWHVFMEEHNSCHNKNFHAFFFLDTVYIKSHKLCKTATIVQLYTVMPLLVATIYF